VSSVPSLRRGALFGSLAVRKRRDDTAIADAGDGATTWRRAVAAGFVAYVVSRIFVAIGAAIVTTSNSVATAPYKPRPRNAFRGMLDVFTSWDSKWYLEIVRRGYPHFVPPNVTYEYDTDHLRAARGAFFPLYPLIIRAADTVLPGRDVAAALAVNLVVGLAAIIGVGWLASQFFDHDVAKRAMILTAFFPGSFVLSLAYAEGLLIVLACACLVWLGQKRWFLAGVAAGLATMTRPNGIALVAACGVAAIVAIHNERAWRSLVAPALAPAGFIGFQLFMRRQTGEPAAWFRIQREAWHEGYSWGWTALREVGNSIIHPLASPTFLMCTLTLVALVFMLVVSRRQRLPLYVWAYTLAIVVLMIIPKTVTARPRFLFTAFPLFIGVAAWWPKKWNDGWTYLMLCCGAGLVAITVLYGGFTAIP